jgi:hypothetical protein
MQRLMPFLLREKCVSLTKAELFLDLPHLPGRSLKVDVTEHILAAKCGTDFIQGVSYVTRTLLKSKQTILIVKPTTLHETHLFIFRDTQLRSSFKAS